MDDQESAGSCTNKKKSWLLARFLDLSQFSFSRTTEGEVRFPPHTHTKKNTGIPQQVYSITLPVLPQSDLQPFTYLIIQWKNGNLQGLPVPGSELTLIPRDPKHHSALHYNWIIWSPDMTQVQTNMGSLGLQTYPLILSLIQICNWNEHTW